MPRILILQRYRSIARGLPKGYANARARSEWRARKAHGPDLSGRPCREAASAGPVQQGSPQRAYRRGSQASTAARRRGDRPNRCSGRSCAEADRQGVGAPRSSQLRDAPGTSSPRRGRRSACHARSAISGVRSAHVSRPRAMRPCRLHGAACAADRRQRRRGRRRAWFG